MVGLKQSPNFLSMRLKQSVNNIKVSSEKYLQKIFILQDTILYQNTFEISYLQDTFKKYLAQHLYGKLNYGGL